MSRYLIALTPVGPFFFGGETTFERSNGKSDQLSCNVIMSSRYPQQTSLLGMLRFWLLSNSDAFNPIEQRISDTRKAARLIGKVSFRIGGPNEFGVITSISTCVVQVDRESREEWCNYYPAPFDWDMQLSFLEAYDVFVNGMKRVIPSVVMAYDYQSNRMERYDQKWRRKDKLVGEKGDEIPIEKIYVKDWRKGINKVMDKNKSGEVTGFFKQMFYRFETKQGSPQFRFAFEVEIADDSITLPAPGIVELGADGSKFALRWELINQEKDLPKPTLFGNKPIAGMEAKVVLTSEARLPHEIVSDNSPFCITEHTPFRNLQTNVESCGDYGSDDGCVKKSARYSLYKRGSVFYFSTKENARTFICGLEEDADMRKIGYNSYQLIENTNR